MCTVFVPPLTHQLNFHLKWSCFYVYGICSTAYYKTNQLAKMYDYVRNFSEKYKLVDVLEKLFDWGVIGNSGQQMVFKFLGFRDFSPTENMIIHTPLRSFFAVKSREQSSDL